MKVAYPAIVHQEDGQYWIEFPDVPGCFTDGNTLVEALDNASEALGGMLCSLLDDGTALPQVSDAAALHPEDGFVSVITTDPLRYKKDTRAVKKTLTLPAWLNEEAEKRHINFSSVLQKALLDLL